MRSGQRVGVWRAEPPAVARSSVAKRASMQRVRGLAGHRLDAAHAASRWTARR